MSPHYDVLVVGAGISGLTAAELARSGGLDVAVLEGRSRVGGRLLSPGGVDLGATWFWSGEWRVEAMLRELSLPAFAQHVTGDGCYETDDGVLRLKGNPIEGPAWRFGTGAQALPAALAERVPVLLGEEVTAITSTGDGVEVISTGGPHRARCVVLAVPPALAVASIDISADLLPDDVRRVAGATPVWMGAIAKVVCRYDEPFWRYESLAGSAVSTLGPLREIHDMSGPDGTRPALFGFAFMDLTEPQLDPERALGQLARIFGPAAARPTELLVADWSRERFTSPSGVQALATTALFGHPVYRPVAGHRLLWASTETSRETSGHVEGAIAAGQRAAEAALALCRE